MIDVFYIGQGDTLPYYAATVRNNEGVVDLSTTSVVSVVFRMAVASTGSVVVSAPATITDATNGGVQYVWAVADTANTGEYAVSFQFYTPSGSYTLPRSTMAKVVVEDRFVTGGN